MNKSGCTMTSITTSTPSASSASLSPRRSHSPTTLSSTSTSPPDLQAPIDRTMGEDNEDEGDEHSSRISIDDIFGSDTPSPESSPSQMRLRREQLERGSSIPSDLPALRRAFLTDGYRAGLDAGKSNPETAQAGFDEGYEIGAALGERVGFILGTLCEMQRFKLAGDASVSYKEAETQLQLEKLFREMEDMEVLGREQEFRKPDRDWAGQLPSVEKWNYVVEQMGDRLGLSTRNDSASNLTPRQTNNLQS